MRETFSSRRRFLGRMARAGLLAAAPLVRPILALARPPAALVRAAVGKLGGMERFVRPGDRVVVKPNIGWDRTPAEAANTHPAVVAEICRLARRAGARSVRVFDRACNDPRRTYERSGIRAALKALGDRAVRLEHVQDSAFAVVKIPGALKLTRWPLYRPALAADVLVNCPVVKHHGLTGVTIAMKNLMGVMGGNRGRIHWGIDDNLVDLNLAVRSHLVVVDATRILTSNGPQGGGTEHVRQVNRVAATTDVVAPDAWGAREFGVDPLSVGHIRRGHERGLGVADLGRVPIL